MTFDEYQDAARRTAVYPDIGHNLTYPTLGLCGEAGEVAEKVKKMFRDDGGELTKERHLAIFKELGDVLWYVAMCAHELGVNLNDVAIGNTVKLAARKRLGALHGSGDDR